MRNAQGTALTDTVVRSETATGRPVTIDIAYFTSMPAHTISIGMNRAHMNPITDCLYFTRMSRQVIMNSSSRYR